MGGIASVHDTALPQAAHFDGVVAVHVSPLGVATRFYHGARPRTFAVGSPPNVTIGRKRVPLSVAVTMVGALRTFERTNVMDRLLRPNGPLLFVGKSLHHDPNVTAARVRERYGYGSGGAAPMVTPSSSSSVRPPPTATSMGPPPPSASSSAATAARTTSSSRPWPCARQGSRRPLQTCV
jgi:hypothetical protein